jgi:hypothetical protein
MAIIILLFYNTIMQSNGSQITPQVESIQNGAWVEGECALKEGRYCIKCTGKIVTLTLSAELTKQINDCKAFGFKTSIVEREFVPAILPAVACAQHIQDGQIVLTFEKLDQVSFTELMELIFAYRAECYSSVVTK